VRPLLTVALSAWLGAGLLFAAVVAPAAFRVLPSRALAGALAGAVLPVLFWTGAAVGVWAIILLRRPPARRWALGLALLLAGASLGSQLVVGDAIARLRASVGAGFETLPTDDARRVTFGRLHALSVLLLGTGMLSAAGLVVHEIRRHH
jgi:hypothetical protein